MQTVEQTPENKFDPAKLRLSQNFSEMVAVKKHIVAIAVGKPNRQQFVRVHPDASYTMEAAILDLKEEGETYLISPELFPQLAGDVVPKVLMTSITKQGVLFLWCIRLPDENGVLDRWNMSAMQATDFAKKAWVKVSSNKAAQCYDVFEAAGKFPEPEWPDLTFQQILGIAFKERFIETMDHPVLKKLRGEI